MNALLFNMMNLMKLRCFLYLKCDELFMIPNVNNVLHCWCFIIVSCNWWIICLTLMFVKSHPFCLKMLLFVWVTCRWSRLVAVVCCCEWLPLTVSLGALIRNGMGTLLMFSILYVFIYEILWTWCWITLMRFYVGAFVPKLLRFWI